MGDFVLKLDPSERVTFTGKKLGEDPITNSLKVVNPTSDRYAFKVKCTSNEMFRIRPPVGVIEAGKDVMISLVFNAGKAVPDNGKHYFVVYYVKSAGESKNARQTWTDHKGDPEGTKRLYVDFKKEGGGEKAEKEKDEKEKDVKKESKDEKKEEKKPKEDKEEKDEKEDKKDEKEEKKDDKEAEDKKGGDKKDEKPKEDKEEKDDDKKEE